MNINKYIKECHEIAVEKGFWDCDECNGKGEKTVICSECKNSIEVNHCKKCNTIGIWLEKCSVCNGTGKKKRDIEEMLMLTIGELGEALEAHRKGKFVKWESFKTYIKEDFILGFESCIKDTFEDEIADVFIRLFDICGGEKIKVNSRLENDFGLKTFENNVASDLFKITKLITVCPIQGYPDIIFSTLLDFCEKYNIDIEKYIKLKMEYNKTREYRHGKNY